MAKSVADKIFNFLDSFSPRTFTNDAQAAQYMFNQGSKKPWTRDEYARLHMDIDQANAHLRSGDMDEETKRFVQAMDAHKIPADSDLIISRTVDAHAFGLTPEQLGAEDGGIEDFTGKLIADRAYNTGQIGGIITAGGKSSGGAAGPGKITMRIAVPKGTPIIPFARHRDDRGMSFDRDQEFRITKVQPDGSGGWYVAAVATPRTKGETPTPVNRAPSGVDLTPEQRAERIRSRAQMREPSVVREEQKAQERIAMAEAAVPADVERRQKRVEDLRLRQTEETVAPQTTEQLPKGVEPRNEPVITPGAGGQPQAPAPEPSAPELPTAPSGEQFRQIVRDANLPSPSRGPRRVAWNEAYLRVASGKRDPGDVLRDLERDIQTFQDVNRENERTGVEDRDLPGDISALEQLADVIRREHGLGARETAAPAPAKAVKKAAPRAKKAVSSEGGTKAAGLTPAQQESVRNRVAQLKRDGRFNPDLDEHKRLQSLVDQMEGTPAKKAAPKAPAAKKAAPAAPTPAKAAKAAAPAKAVRRMPELTTAEKRDLSDLSPSEQRSYRARRTAGRSHEEALQSAREAGAARGRAPMEAFEEAKAGKPLEKHTISELRKIASDEDVELKSRMLKADIVKEIQHARTNRAAEDAARAQQAEYDRIRPFGDVASEIEQLVGDKASDRALKARIRSRAKTSKLPDDMRDQLLASDREGLVELAERLAREQGVTPVGRIGEVTSFDPTRYDGPGLNPRDSAVIVRRSFLSPDGRVLTKGFAEAATPEEVRAVKRVPKGSVPGPRVDAPVSTPERRTSFKEAWDGSDIGAPSGSAGRSMREIRDDVSSGKLTPEEGIRRMESEVALNQDELNDIDAALRGNMSPAERRKLIAQAESLEQAIESQKRASTFMRGHFEAEPPVTKKELLQLEVPAEVHRAIQEVDPEALKDEAVRQGLDRPSGDTADEVIQDIARKMAEQELARRATKAAKKAAPPKLPTEKGKVDVRLIAEGLDLPPERLDKVQAQLDGGKLTPAAIGRELEREAKAIRSAGAIRYGGLRGEDRTPESEALKQRDYDLGDRVEQLAERLKSTRRPAVKKAAPAKKVAPEVKAAEARADTLETRIKQSALERLQGAKTEQQVRDAVAGLTFPELRDLGAQHGVKGRSKAGITQGLVDRYTAPREVVPTPSPAKKAQRAAPAARLAEVQQGERASRLREIAQTQSTQLRQATGRPGPPVARASRVTDGNGRIKPIQRANEDEPIHLPNGGADQGLVHLDSSLGELWSDLYTDQREPNSFINEIARLGEGVGKKREGQLDLESDVIPGLKKLKTRASDSAVADRIQETIDALSAPPAKPLDLPEGVPGPVRRALEDLARIPTARKTGQIGANRETVSVLDQMLDTVRKISRGEMDPREAERELTKRHLHESGDGAVQMWEITNRLGPLGESRADYAEVRAWIRRSLKKEE